LTPGSSAPEPPDLWSRFAAGVGLDPTAYDQIDHGIDVVSASLGPAETELLRIVHARQDPRFTDPQRHVWTRQLLANNVLARRPAAPIRLPDDARPWLKQRSDRIVAELRHEDYAVVDDLDALDWAEPPQEARLVSDVESAELDEVAGWTILRLQEALVHREPVASPPPVGPQDGVDGILELLEHIRAADTGRPPRPAPEGDPSRVQRIRRALPGLRSR
jgi:hypothetical protein